MRDMDRWISARTPLATSAERATKMLLEDPRGLIPEAGHRSTSTAPVIDLSVVVGGGSAVRQDVEVTLGTPRSAENEAWVPISWQPLSHSRVLPSFEGALEVIDDDGSSELSITGTYHVPLGIVGRFGDGVVGRRIAQQSIKTFLERVAQHVDEVVGDELAHSGWRPAPYPVDLRERRPYDPVVAVASAFSAGGAPATAPRKPPPPIAGSSRA